MRSDDSSSMGATQVDVAPFSADEKHDLAPSNLFAQLSWSPPPPPGARPERCVDLSLCDCDRPPSAESDAALLAGLLPDWFCEGSSLPLNFEPSKETVTQALIEIHRKAGFLRGFPPLSLWRWAQKKRWEQLTTEFVPYFKLAIRSGKNTVELLKLFLRILELPSIILQQNLPEQKGVSPGKSALTNKLRKVESLALQDRLHDASKVLFSHGVAQADEGLFDRLQKLHPTLKDEIPETSSYS